MSPHDHLLLPQLLGHVLGAAAGHVDPGLGEECAGAEHKEDVEECVNGVGDEGAQALRRRQVITESCNIRKSLSQKIFFRKIQRSASYL